jgi:serine/threonine protein kinase
MKLRLVKALPSPLTRLRFKGKTSKGEIVFVKANYCGKKRLKYDPREKILSEIKILKLLKGLAVPHLVSVSKKELSEHIHSKKFDAFAVGWLPGRSALNLPMNAAQGFGLWLFILEQLVAARRTGFIHTDIKPGNILVSGNFTEAYLIDFDFCTPRSRNGHYSPTQMGIGPGFNAPEQVQKDQLTERTPVYQLGMTLGHFIDNRFGNYTRDQALRAVLAKLKKLNDLKINSLFQACIAIQESKRPRDLECIYKKVLQCCLPEESFLLWRKLRKPSEKKLHHLGLSLNKVRVRP